MVVGLTLLCMTSAENEPSAFVKSLTGNCREIGWEPTCEVKARDSNDNKFILFALNFRRLIFINFKVFALQ